MREWLSGRASPCQGESRGFDPRLPLHFFISIGRRRQVVRHGSAKAAQAVRIRSSPPIRRDFSYRVFFHVCKVSLMRSPHSYATEAIVLKRTDLGEADRMLVLFTPVKGKIHAVAKGTRRPISKLAGHVDLLCRSQLQLALGRNLDIVTQAEGRENFLHLRSDLWHMTCGFYLAELVDRFVEDSTPHLDIYSLLLETLRYLDADATALEQQITNSTAPAEDGVDENGHTTLLLRYFELHLLSSVGYEPSLQNCA